MTDLEYYRDLVDPVLASRKWILLADVAAAATPSVQYLAEIGAGRPFVLSGTPGTGDLPDPELAEVAILGTSGATIMQGMRAYFAAIADLPDGVQDRIDSWDPNHTAMVLPTGLAPNIEVHGRPMWAGRRAEWSAVEDKTTVDALWDDAGVARAPSEVVPASAANLYAAADRLDTGAGTVWVGDNREGWHGGAEYVRLVTDDDTAAGAVSFMESHCDTTRVMPFLEGIPCSIHAMVFPDGEYSFRPCEMLVFRTPGSPLFRYAGVTSWWEPAPADRREMQSAATAVAAVLRDRMGYRGALGIDGVMTAEGFRPTELNPRCSIGLSIQGQGPETPFPIASINRLLVAGQEADYRAAGFHRLVMENGAVNPQMRANTPIDKPCDETTTAPIEVIGGEVRVTTEAEAHGTLRVGPAAQGGIVMFNVESEYAVVGPSAAPIAASAFRLADDLWDTGICPLIPADVVR